jgi:hypothetical protein
VLRIWRAVAGAICPALATILVPVFVCACSPQHTASSDGGSVILESLQTENILRADRLLGNYSFAVGSIVLEG